MTNLLNLGKDSIVIRSIQFIDSDAHQDQYYRPFETSANRSTVERLTNSISEQIMENYSTGNRTNLHLGSETFDFLKPRGNVNRKRDFIDVAGGWNGDRLNFIMKVECESNLDLGFMRELVVVGYTNYRGVSDHGFQANLDEENMELYINSVIDISQSRTRTVSSNRTNRKINGFSSAVSTNPHRSSNSMSINSNDQLIYTARPSDVAKRLSAISAVGNAEIVSSNIGTYGRNSGFINSQFGFSDRNTHNPTHYIGSLFHAHGSSTMKAAADGSKSDHGSLLSNTSRLLGQQQNNTLQSAFITALNRGDMCNFKSTQHFTLSDLYMIDPSLKTEEDNRVTYFKVTDSVDGGYTSYTNNWDGADRTSQAAKIIGDTLPSLLVANRFSSIGLTAYLASNKFGEAEWVVTTGSDLTDNSKMGSGTVLSGMESLSRGGNRFGGNDGITGIGLLFEDENLSHYEITANIESLKMRLISEILDPLTFNRASDLYINVSCDIKGATVIELSFDDEPHDWFAQPTNMDSLSTPILTSNSKDVNNLVGDFKQIFDGLGFDDFEESDAYSDISDDLSGSSVGRGIRNNF